MPAKRTWSYLHDSADPPPQTYRTRDAEWRQSVWQSMRKVDVPRLCDLYPLMAPEPATVKRLIEAAIEAYSDEPSERSRFLREHFKGKLHSDYPLNRRIIAALAFWVDEVGRETMYCPEAEVDPVDRTVDFLTLLALRLERLPFAQP